MKTQNLALAMMLAAFVAAPVAASPVTVDVVGTGWCLDGFCNNTNTDVADMNTYVGDTAGGPTVGAEIRGWWAFDVPLAGGSFQSGTINIWNAAGNVTDDPSSIFSLYHATSVDFAGLAGGSSALGSIPVDTANTGVGHYVAIDLNDAALAFLSGAEGSRFIFGGAMQAPNGSLFFGRPDRPEAFLSLTPGDARPSGCDPDVDPNCNVAIAPVPEPASLLLLGTGILAIAGRIRRRMQ